jgi:ABC-type nitrate/sulfonate/bicarbonate transport system permease component
MSAAVTAPPAAGPTAPEAPPAGIVDDAERGQRRSVPPWAGGVLGIGSLLVIWQLLGMFVFEDSGVVPPPTAILAQFGTDGLEFYWNNLTTTLREATWGYVYGNVLAIGLAIAFVQVPFLEKALLKLAVASYCLPIVAIGPILAILYKGDTPKIILAAMSVFFTTLIAMLVGLRSADRTSLELVHAYGGGSWKQLRKVRLKYSLPSLFAGLRIAAPAAVLGAMIGEYMGGESGLGVSMINSQQALQTERTWAIALTATFLSATAYGITALVGRLLTPWAPRMQRGAS